MNESLLKQLTERLPELEWKMNSLGTVLPINSLPKGLFRTIKDLSTVSCIAEIKADIQRLASQKNSPSACYLAECIQQKISVLVGICHLQANKPKATKRVNFALDKISTRQQWMQHLEEEVTRLSEQQEALTRTLAQSKVRGEPQAVLKLQAELGEVEKRLTLAKETRQTV